MKIEILFPEFCNLFGDMSNMRYLKLCLPEAEFVETALEEEPFFVNEDVSLIYMGPMTERTQEKVIQKLKPYQERIKELIQKNTVFLMTGNAIEIFGEYIENEDGSKIEGLGIFSVHAKRNMMNRHNSFAIGKLEEIEVVGFKSQFTMMYGDNTNQYFLELEAGIGINPDTKLEGIKDHYFIGTYLIGPILILNPLLTKKILEMMGVEKPQIALEKETMQAYEERLKELKRLNVKNT